MMMEVLLTVRGPDLYTRHDNTSLPLGGAEMASTTATNVENIRPWALTAIVLGVDSGGEQSSGS
jgi:hypothetical protein